MANQERISGQEPELGGEKRLLYSKIHDEYKIMGKRLIVSKPKVTDSIYLNFDLFRQTIKEVSSYEPHFKLFPAGDSNILQIEPASVRYTFLSEDDILRQQMYETILRKYGQDIRKNHHIFLTRVELKKLSLQAGVDINIDREHADNVKWESPIGPLSNQLFRKVAAKIGERFEILQVLGMPDKDKTISLILKSIHPAQKQGL